MFPLRAAAAAALLFLSIVPIPAAGAFSCRERRGGGGGLTSLFSSSSSSSLATTAAGFAFSSSSVARSPPLAARTTPSRRWKSSTWLATTTTTTKSTVTNPVHRRSLTALPAAATADDAIDSLDPDRRSNLFQSLLRDLQIEGVPILGCDADQVHTLCAALWTTMAELSEKDESGKVCLVMENIPLDALRAFVQDFSVLKGQPRLMAHLREMGRISVSLVGKGVGPAFIIETTERTPEEKEEAASRTAIESTLDETKCTAALKSFVDRVVVGLEQCPYTKSSDVAAVGLEARGVVPGPIGYRYSGSSDACAALSAFWNTVCELLSVSERDISTAMLSLPGIGPGNDDEAHARFSAVVELIGRNLCLYRGDGVFGLVHFHPAYDRSKIVPATKPAYGHLPPRSWMRSMMRMAGEVEKAEGMTDEELALSDYQRRAPHTSINVLRVSQISAAAGAKSIVDLELEDGTTEKASGITLYTRNAIRLAAEGKERLEAGVEADMALQR